MKHIGLLKDILIVVLLGLLIYPHVVKTKMPEWVNVNGIMWRIIRVDNIAQGSAYYGLTNCNNHTILIKKSEYLERESLMHELTHAPVCMDAANDFGVNNMYYNSSTPLAHEGFDKFGDIWSEMLLRNPQLALYLSGR